MTKISNPVLKGKEMIRIFGLLQSLFSKRMGFFVLTLTNFTIHDYKDRTRNTGHGHGFMGVTMPAIASLEDLKAAQKDLLEANDIDELKEVGFSS